MEQKTSELLKKHVMNLANESGIFENVFGMSHRSLSNKV